MTPNQRSPVVVPAQEEQQGDGSKLDHVELDTPASTGLLNEDGWEAIEDEFDDDELDEHERRFHRLMKRYRSHPLVTATSAFLQGL